MGSREPCTLCNFGEKGKAKYKIKTKEKENKPKMQGYEHIALYQRRSRKELAYVR